MIFMSFLQGGKFDLGLKVQAHFFEFPADLWLRDADDLCSLTLREVAQQRLNNHPVVQGAGGHLAQCLIHASDGDDALHIHGGIRDQFRSKLLPAFMKADGFIQREKDEGGFARFGTLAAEKLEQLVLNDAVGERRKGEAGIGVIHAGSFAQSDAADLKQVLKGKHAILMLGGKALDGEGDKFQIVFHKRALFFCKRRRFHECQTARRMRSVMK